MKLKFLIDEDMVNYKEPSMFVGFPYCSFKCEIDCGEIICQNHPNYNLNLVNVSIDNLCKRFIDNDLSKSLVLGGFEPLDSPFDVETLIDTLRNKYNCNSPIIIYTGYTEEECNGIHKKEYQNVNYEKLQAVYNQIISYSNIIIKFGRFIPNMKSHFDDVLGVNLASDNQYAKRFNWDNN